jgi:hypothetical protein
LLETGVIVTGKVKNQFGTVKRARDTRWGSNFNSICNLISKYEATCTISIFFCAKEKKIDQHVNGDSSYNYLKSFDFLYLSRI